LPTSFQFLIRWLILRVEHPLNYRRLNRSGVFAYQGCRRHKQCGKYDNSSKNCCCDIHQISDAQNLFKKECGEANE